MRRSINFVILAILLLAMAGAAAADDSAPAGQSGQDDGASVVAEVNGKNVSRADLVRQMRQITMQSYRHGELTPEITEQIRKKALDRVIVEELAYQKAEKLGITIPPEYIDNQIEQLRKSLGSEERFQNYLYQQGVDLDRLKIQVRRYLMVKKAIAMEVDAKIQINPADLTKAYEETKDQYIQAERVQVTDVVFFLDADEPESWQKANRIRAQIEAEFDNDPAKLSSDGTFIVREGIDLQESREPGLYVAAKKLEPGGVSEVIVADRTMHIIKLTGYRPRIVKTEAEVKPDLEKKIKSELKERKIEEWMAGLRKGARIRVVE